MAIGVYGSIHPEAEDIFWGFVARADSELSKERSFLFEGSLEAEVRDFLGRGVDLLVIVAVDSLAKDLLVGFDFGDLFSHRFRRVAPRASHMIFPSFLWLEGRGHR